MSHPYVVMDVPKLDDPRHQQLLEWLLTPPAHRQPKTKNALAAELGVADRTLRGWEERPEFITAWRLGFQATAGSLERTKAVLDQLFEDSMDADSDKRVQAAKLYWDISRTLAPPEPDKVASRRAQELSDVELRALLSEAAAAELDARYANTLPPQRNPVWHRTVAESDGAR